MKNKNNLYTKICKRCGKTYQSEKKYSKSCEQCKKMRGGAKK